MIKINNRQNLFIKIRDYLTIINIHKINLMIKTKLHKTNSLNRLKQKDKLIKTINIKLQDKQMLIL